MARYDEAAGLELIIKEDIRIFLECTPPAAPVVSNTCTRLQIMQQYFNLAETGTGRQLAHVRCPFNVGLGKQSFVHAQYFYTVR